MFRVSLAVIFVICYLYAFCMIFICFKTAHVVLFNEYFFYRNREIKNYLALLWSESPCHPISTPWQIILRCKNITSPFLYEFSWPQPIVAAPGIDSIGCLVVKNITLTTPQMNPSPLYTETIIDYPITNSSWWDIPVLCKYIPTASRTKTFCFSVCWVLFRTAHGKITNTI